MPLLPAFCKSFCNKLGCDLLSLKLSLWVSSKNCNSPASYVCVIVFGLFVVFPDAAGQSLCHEVITPSGQVFPHPSHLQTWGYVRVWGIGGGTAALAHSEPASAHCCWDSAWPSLSLQTMTVQQPWPHRVSASPSTRAQQTRNPSRVSWQLWSSPSCTQSSLTLFLKVSFISFTH